MCDKGAKSLKMSRVGEFEIYHSKSSCFLSLGPQIPLAQSQSLAQLKHSLLMKKFIISFIDVVYKYTQWKIQRANKKLLKKLFYNR